MKYKLDNAANIFPFTYNKKNTSSFKLVATLKSDVNSELLQKALDITINRYPMYKTRLARGFFWYLLKTKNERCIVLEETDIPFTTISPLNKTFLLQTFYKENRIIVELHHSLTDANGGMEFLKSLCFNYLNLCGNNIVNNNSILVDNINDLEFEDSFHKVYDKKAGKLKGTPKAYGISGQRCDIITKHIILSVKKLKEVCGEYTITQYVGGLILYSLYLNSNPDKQITLFLPVNARKYFDSKTLKNFMLYIRSSLELNKEINLKGCIDTVANTLNNELSKDFLLAVNKSNVSIEKNFFVNYMNLLFKIPVMKLGCKLLVKNTCSIVFSNIGVVNTPDEMNGYVDNFSFSISPSDSLPITFSAASYNDKLVLTFTRNILEDTIINTFIEELNKICLIEKIV